MTRLLVCFAYFFRGVRILPWVSGVGLFMIAFEVFMPGNAAGTLVSFGAILFAGFPTLLGGPFYRQLIGNRRMALVPGLRYFATAALFLLALCGAALAAFAATQLEPRYDPWRVGQLAFALISLYLLVSQWLVARPATMIGFVLLPWIAFGLVFSDRNVATESLLVPWAWLSIAGLGWLWLAIAVSRHALAHRWLARRIPGTAAVSETPGFWQSPDAWLDPSSFATAAGTLMRGRGDSWRNRLNGALVMVLLLPAAMSGLVLMLAILGEDTEDPRFGGIFLGTSFLVVCVLPKALFGEWPARLRLLWLRVAGDRPELWRRTERTLLQEVALIVAILLPVAGGILILYDVPRHFVYVYLAGAALGVLTSSYAGFLARISCWGFVGQAALFVVVIMTFTLVGVALRNSAEPRSVLALLPLLLALALGFRWMARSRFRRMDWCQVRPRRFPRQSI